MAASTDEIKRMFEESRRQREAEAAERDRKNQEEILRKAQELKEMIERNRGK